MKRLFYAQKDTTLYEKYPEQNTGIDQILELTKIASGSKLQGIIQANTYNSRFLIDFGSELTVIQDAITSGDIPTFDSSNIASASAYLRLFAANASDLLQSYDIKAFPVSESWINGGGNYSDTPIQKYGTSWYYRSGDDIADQWKTGSAHSVGQMGSTETLIGGGTWITGSGYEASQSFQNESPDLKIDVTDIVSKWADDSLTNNGFIVKRPHTDEISGEVLGKLQFFGRESHTIYVPRLEVCWDDSSMATSAGISSKTYIPYIKNIKSEYRTSDIARFYIGCRPEFPSKTYSTSSFYMTNDRLPISSSYEIIDSVTNDIIIQDETEWGNSTTKISNYEQDANPADDVNFFDLRMDSFMPERYYKIKLTCRRSNDTQTFDDFYFKVVR
tara:strand:+ start:3938 stop:5101 length:1164 start_codon:yes stop_codon:yes gene_type:complete